MVFDFDFRYQYREFLTLIPCLFDFHKPGARLSVMKYYLLLVRTRIALTT